VKALVFLLAATAAAQPAEQGEFLATDLVELIKLDLTIRLDIRYATTNNFAGQKVYTQARAFLQRPAAEALVRVHRKLDSQGLGLLVFDGYRPWSVTQIFWDITPPEKRNFVANPRSGSKHNRGCAVDLTLYDRKTGKALPMPSEYDEFSDRAYVAYEGGTEQERRNRELLRRAMEAEGFAVVSHEWWHFDYKDWRKYRIENVPFEQLR
jgi:D-alanyl-D-alanine dipeptidase